ncbi:Phosphate ABC transporter, periplasmic phosphate-binding protein PstS (TC 3.A.1.7.1) [Rhodovastum atsumiense]|nr:Phosphate ABC transporter, periplasmic phosphate-binding protein PstS (TC 3.A.1.7.1) [Rhodovastum atsumiense]
MLLRNRISAMMLALMLCAGPAGAEVLRAGGTGGATALLVHLGRPFTAQSGIAVDVVPSLGSGGSIAAAADGMIDLVVSARPLTAAERARGLDAVATLRTPFVLATSHPAPSGLAAGAVAGMFVAVKPAWPDGAVLRPILRPRTETDTLVLAALFPGMAAALEQARQRPDLPVAATDQDNADLAEHLEGSLTGITLAQLVLEGRALRLVPLDGVTPSLAGFEAGDWRYGRDFILIARRPAAPAVGRFLQFLHSEAGRAALRAGACLDGGA